MTSRWTKEYQREVWKVAEYAAETWAANDARGPAHIIIETATTVWAETHMDEEGPCVDSRDVEAMLLEAALSHMCVCKAG